MNQMKLRQAGFTLIELLVVITIILLLGGFGVSKFIEAQRDAEMTASKDRLGQIYFHMQRYEQKKGRLPGKMEDGSTVSGPAFVCAIWGGGILEKSKNNAEIFFCNSLAAPPLTEENVDEWVIPEEIHWAGLNQEDPNYSKSRMTAKGSSKTIIACNKPLFGGEMPHAGRALAIVYMNGSTGEMDRSEWGDDWPEDDELIIGPESPVEAMQGLKGDDY